MSAHSLVAIEIFDGLLEFAGESVDIDGTVCTGQVSEIGRDDVYVPGGQEDQGSLRIKLKLSDFPSIPLKHGMVIARGKRLLLVEPATRRNGHVEVTASYSRGTADTDSALLTADNDTLTIDAV